MNVVYGELPVSEYIPRVMPPGWTVIGRWGDGYKYMHRSGLRVIASTADFPDGRDWMHISFSREDRLPNYEDQLLVKDAFARERYAYQVFPPPEKHVNIHNFCLHLWVPLNGDMPLPDFTRGGNTI